MICFVCIPNSKLLRYEIILKICERFIDVQKDIYICSIDYNKAFDRVKGQNFDRVKHDKMIGCLAEIAIDDKDLQIIEQMNEGLNG